MAEYLTPSDALVALNGTFPFSVVSIPCNTGNVIPLAVGVINLKGNTPNKFARYNVSVQANIAVQEEGELTPVAVGIAINSVVIPESIAIYTPQDTEEYGHINIEKTVTVPCGCCISVSAVYVDGTEDDASVVPTPSILVRRNASITIERKA